MADQLIPTLQRERALWSAGHRCVAGIDEVGRGAWAGPVTVGIAVLTPETERAGIPQWLRDSKLIPEDEREGIFKELTSWCDAWSVGHAEAAECDRFGMTAALRLAGLRALGKLRRRTDAFLVDGPYDLLKDRGTAASQAAAPADSPRRLPWATVEAEFQQAVGQIRRRRPPKVVLPVVDGDAHCAAVAAASILAKVVRDRRMRRESEHFPGYDFDSNKGYPSPVHLLALRGYGLTSIHRRTWAFADSVFWLSGGPAPWTSTGGRLFGEAEYSLTDDVPEDLVGPTGDPYSGDSKH